MEFDTISTMSSETVIDYRKLPTDLTPLNLLAYFGHAFGACGCSDIADMYLALLELLEWHNAGEGRVKYDELFETRGIFYLLAGLVDNLGLSEHGTAIRYPWLTDDGRRLLSALAEHGPDKIESASGKAYDGCHYGNE